VLYVLMALSGGSAGPGRMSAIGVPAALSAAGLLAAGMAIGAAITAAVASARRPADDAGEVER
jgi:hypothetical protein